MSILSAIYVNLYDMYAINVVAEGSVGVPFFGGDLACSVLAVSLAT